VIDFLGGGGGQFRNGIRNVVIESMKASLIFFILDFPYLTSTWLRVPAHLSSVRESGLSKTGLILLYGIEVFSSSLIGGLSRPKKMTTSRLLIVVCGRRSMYFLISSSSKLSSLEQRMRHISDLGHLV
jgi:hypothetical protein